MREKEATVVVDRYKYIDLFPCNENELKGMKYKVSIYSRLCLVESPVIIFLRLIESKFQRICRTELQFGLEKFG